MEFSNEQLQRIKAALKLGFDCACRLWETDSDVEYWRIKEVLQFIEDMEKRSETD